MTHLLVTHSASIQAVVVLSRSIFQWPICHITFVSDRFVVANLSFDNFLVDVCRRIDYFSRTAFSWYHSQIFLFENLERSERVFSISNSWCICLWCHDKEVIAKRVSSSINRSLASWFLVYKWKLLNYIRTHI